MRILRNLCRATLLGAGIMSLGVAIAGDSNSRLITYQNEGESLFALSLLPNTPADNVSRKFAIAIVVDTSASQSGSYRSDS
ncbi:MAG: hypothetical protein KGQ60_17985, partial [Planctomycetes bacterium]|nr:hypothetical protein [Planctomycetota bacterium]